METQLALTPNQRTFTEAYLDTGNATEAAVRAYKPKNRNTAHAIGAENLRKPTIRAFLDEKAIEATANIYKLSKGAKSESVRLNASKDILNRAGYSESPIQKPEDTKILFVPSDIANLCGLESGSYTVVTIAKELIERDNIETPFSKLMARPRIEKAETKLLAA
jgi:hypothetical protein